MWDKLTTAVRLLKFISLLFFLFFWRILLHYLKCPENIKHVINNKHAREQIEQTKNLF